MNKNLGASLMMVKSFCVVGGPSVSKTSLMKMILLKAISLGLNGLLMTLMSEQAFPLGGIHLHKLLLLPVHEKMHCATSCTACIKQYLFTNP
jgi:hypothetical protein